MNFLARVYYTIFVAGFVVQYAKTWYYGWNWQAMSSGEKDCDRLVFTMVVIGLIGMAYYKWSSK